MFTYLTSVKLHHTDSAGLLFFAHQLTLVHDAYECFMEEAGVSFHYVLNEADYLLAIVRAEADYTRPLSVGDRLEIRLYVERIGKTSFTLTYDIRSADQRIVGNARTVHVCMDKGSRQKRDLPDALKAALSK